MMPRFGCRRSSTPSDATSITDLSSDTASHTSSETYGKPTFTRHGSTLWDDDASVDDASSSVSGHRWRWQASRTVKSLVKLRILRPGDFFGVGEDLSESRIITTSKVTATGIHPNCMKCVNHIVSLSRCGIQEHLLTAARRAYYCFKL